MRFEGKVALVTGASSGIGLAAARLLAAEGAAVGMLSWDAAGLEEAVRSVAASGGRALALVADVSQSDQVRAAVECLAGEHGRIDIVFANAGINGVWAPVDEIEPDEWDRTLGINLKGAFLTIKHTVPWLRRQGGSITITSSGHGTRIYTIPGSTAYACSKGALVVLAKKLALELARDRIRVNVICPTSTYTRINETTVARDIDRIRLPIEFPKGKIPLTGERKATPEQVARLFLFLASDDADMITGTEVWVDGGQSLMMG